MTSQRRKKRSGLSEDETRRYTVRGVRRDPLDIGKLSKALLGLAMAEAERLAAAEHRAHAAANEPAASADEHSQDGSEHDVEK
jgi:hypothetical protein